MLQRTRTRFLSTLLAPALSLSLASAIRAQDVLPAPSPEPAAAPDAPTTAPSATRAAVAPDAQAVLEQIKTAYAGLKSATLEGNIQAEFDVAGRQQKQSVKFNSSFAEPNKYRHEVEDGILAGSTGDKAYVYSKPDNSYVSETLPVGGGRFAAGELPRPHGNILHEQNPSMALALSDDASAELIKGVSNVEKADDVSLDGKPTTALKLTQPDGISTLVQVDPTTHLVRRITHDLKQYLSGQGAPDVKTANVTIDYTKTATGEPIAGDQFAWTPPEGAQETSLDAAAAANEGGDRPAMALVGKPAPDFTLDNLAGEKVTLSKLKGDVVVLDFWATWCGPCVQSMPGLQKLAKETESDGVKVFAVNLMEDKPTVEEFLKSHNLTLKALLDTEGKVAEEYKAQAIPQTVVIGKDGVVRNVFIGAGPDTEQKLHDAVKEAVKG